MPALVPHHNFFHASPSFSLTLPALRVTETNREYFARNNWSFAVRGHLQDIAVSAATAVINSM
ncbi:hypothetical protein I7I53_09709 [Histoplasma capsulatum var. duboisii H88]|uniref:Uncharacterized protein n=1 Tax=Ajellomyces capsulatus (strain H88) TaxID=544711 RepID=A0A8A1L793_AJEC8|nr:hypothetical protein I7I53_09709 [Histoplasma capsulatum var. duboisii H88]